MRVLQLGPLYKNHLRRWSSHAAALGCTVYAAGHVRPGRHQIDLSELVEEVEVAPERLYGAGAEEHLGWLGEVLEAFRPDLLQAHWLPRWGYAAAQANGPPVVVTPWGSDVYLARGAERARADAALRGADAVLARSGHMERELIGRGVPAARVHRADLGVDLERFRPAGAEERGALRAELGLPEGPLVLSFRDGLENYNLDVVAEAFEGVPGASLAVIHGHDPPPERIRALDTAAVRVLGHVPHERIHDYMRAATVGISIPHSDGSPSSVWEALACGLPVVLSDLPQLVEKVGGCEAVALVEPKAEAVAAALARLLDESEERRAAARSWAEANFDQRAQIARLGEVYAASSSR